MDDKTILTVEGVASMLEVKEATVRKAISESRLKAFKQFGRWYVFYEDLVNFIRAGKESVTP